jgi:rod shape-determining protein MreD
MRWIMFLILLYVMSAFQAAHFLGIPSGDRHWPELLYLQALAIFYAMFANEAEAPLAALACGLMIDLLSTPTVLVGTNMIPLGITALLVVRTRLVIFREQMFAQGVMTLLALLLFALVSTIFRVLIGTPALEGQSFWTQLFTLIVDAGYTAAFAPFIFWLFFRFPQMLGFSSRVRERR